MKSTVVIVTLNRKELASKLVTQIRKFNPSEEIIVIDQSGKQPNLCQGRNEGYKKALGEIIIYFDDDVEITENTIQSHLAEYEDDSVIGVAGRVINDDEPIPEKSAVLVGKVNNLLTDFTKNFWSTKKQIVEFPYGCNMSFRKNILAKVNGFDERIPAPSTAFDEIEIALRIKKFGKIIFSPTALVFHHRVTMGGTRAGDSFRKKQYYQSYGRLIKKHTPSSVKILAVGQLIVRILKEAPYALPSFIGGLLLP